MYSSIIAHFAEGIQLQDRIVNKEFHASKILKFLRQTNPKFYPSPKREVESTDGVHNVDTLEDGFLTESNFCELYDKSCGNLMHAKRKNPFAGKHNDYFNEIETYVNKIIGLLNHHWVHVTDDVVFAVIMQADTNGDVHVAKLAAVATKSM